MKVCATCGSDWAIYGKEWLRTERNCYDYTCKKCKSKKKPVIKDRSGILVIPDLHFPFVREGYLEFLKETYDKYNCNEVIQLGDILDHHYSSFHDSDPDGLSENVEYKKAITGITELAEAFPYMKICTGNHDAIPSRKAFASGLSSRWIRTTKEALMVDGCPVAGWDFQHSFIVEGIKFCHGTNKKAKPRMMQDSMSVVQGHYHSESYIWWHVNARQKTFAMQLGALIDDSAYAFAYAKDFGRSHKNCGVIIDGTPIIEYWNLTK